MPSTVRPLLNSNGKVERESASNIGMWENQTLQAQTSVWTSIKTQGCGATRVAIRSTGSFVNESILRRIYMYERTYMYNTCQNDNHACLYLITTLKYLWTNEVCTCTLWMVLEHLLLRLRSRVGRSRIPSCTRSLCGARSARNVAGTRGATFL